jgi:propanol-preferring alcohol dehydrogenase
MHALVLESPGGPLVERDLADPEPGPGEVALDVRACGVCRTDLHVHDGELPHAMLPLVLGHEIVGIVTSAGEGVEAIAPGSRVGVPWLGWTCGTCAWCRSGRENLCPDARFTGYQRPGGYATRTVADARYVFSIPDAYSDVDAAPLLCAGLIGFRALRFAGDAHRIGIYGFGGAAHIVAQVAIFEGREVFAFTRSHDVAAQAFARELGVAWAGDSTAPPPAALDAALIFAPVGELVPAALRAVTAGGTVVCAGIHMSEIPAFPYEALWGERTIRSVANLTRRDGDEFFAVAARAGIRTSVVTYPLAAANDALYDLRAGRFQGAAVLVAPGE